MFACIRCGCDSGFGESDVVDVDPFGADVLEKGDPQMEVLAFAFVQRLQAILFAVGEELAQAIEEVSALENDVGGVVEATDSCF